MSLTVTQTAALARTQTAETERARMLSSHLADSLTDAGFARHFVPKLWGGEAGSFTEAAEAAAELGEASAATAWCAALYAAHARLAAYLPEQGRQDLWERTPDVRIAASVMPPAGTAEEAHSPQTAAQAGGTAEGWWLEGTWHHASGVDHAHWILLASWASGDTDRTVRLFAVPRDACEVSDTWHTLGLRGTGSNTVRLERTFVPAHRTCTLADLGRLEPGLDRCHSVPYQMVAGAQFLAPALGAARQALRDWHELTADRIRLDGSRAADAPAQRDAAARASAEIHAAGLLLNHALQRADLGEITPRAVAENVRDFAFAAELIAAAADRLVRAAGLRAQAEDCSLQRRWRDIRAAAGHAALDFEAAGNLYAQARTPMSETAR
ncbi:acyl-CoA dehydrogenase family protein [Streptomyces jumonjinensis]|uniref:acyl-CoA dehydrogenase family protein n=1 Tax=Streptomyces jumonjinensis TaxID=1945 RepID=UPI003795A3D4